MKPQPKAIIIDNVNNLSGAPMVARSIAKILHAPIFCLRQETAVCYNAVGFGIQSNERIDYISGVILSLLKVDLLRRLLVANVIICNTSLTFPFVILSRLLGKFTVCVVHESAKKNILYKVSLFLSIKFANILVTPSRSAYASLDMPIGKWKVIHNTIPVEYSFPTESIPSDSDDIYILFAGGERFYKGGQLFSDLAKYATRKNQRLHFHSVGDPNFIQYAGDCSKLTVDIYSKYHFLLVLTDNAIWKETFGLVGCESAASRCIPLFTDRYAYSELWTEYLNTIFLPVYEPISIFNKIESLLIDRNAFDTLRSSLRTHALRLTDAETIKKRWKAIISKSSDAVGGN